MSKCTKGKWEIKGNGVAIFDRQNKTAHFITYNIYGWTTEEAQANARLIAAAPEMYEMLKEEIIPTSDYGGIISFEREKKIKTLLARIDGEGE